MAKYKLIVIACLLIVSLTGIFTSGERNSVVSAYSSQDLTEIDPTAANFNLIPPIKKKKLLTWLKEGNYKKAFIPEPAIHASTGPHGGNVRTFYNPILVEDLRAGRTTWRVGASMVKELYFSGQAQVIGFSVMVKLDENSGSKGEGWLFYETFSGTNDNAFFGRAVPVCANCHGAGLDYLLSPFRP